MIRKDTIAAISTPLGKSGIGIVRLSGEDAIPVAERVFRSPGEKDLLQVASHTLHYGFVYDFEEEKNIDEVLVSVMKAPKTYTREDIVEINCHGGVVPVRETLDLVLKAGARMAEPGEFTRRAFLHGRLTLDQAKSVQDLVESKTRLSLELSMNRLEGKFSKFLVSLREELSSLLAKIEVMIDFPDYEESVISQEELVDNLTDMIDRIEEFLLNSKDGRILKEGHKIAILGRPNVGKSTLLNRLLREERAIVSSTPGTTRDTIEAELEIEGIPFQIVDTAGIRGTDKEVEQEGVRRAKQQGEQSEIALFLIDAHQGVTESDRRIAHEMDPKKTVLVCNKIDLVDDFSKAEFVDQLGNGWVDLVAVSAQQGERLEALKQEVVRLVWGGKIKKEGSTVLLDLREKQMLQQAKGSLEDALTSAKRGRSIDLVEVDIREARKTLGELLGEDVSEEILDRVFSQFCVGK